MAAPIVLKSFHERVESKNVQILITWNTLTNYCDKFNLFELFHDGGPYHIETSRANQWTGFYLIGISDMKELNVKPLWHRRE